MTHTAQIDAYAQGARKLREAIAGLSDDELRLAPVPGKWSTQQVVVHLADAEAAFADRIKRLIAEDEPVLQAWDENRFAQRLHYETQSTADAVQLIDALRRQIAHILRRVDEPTFARTGRHSQRGTQTLADVLTVANNHLEHHLKFIAEKRAKLGK